MCRANWISARISHARSIKIMHNCSQHSRPMIGFLLLHHAGNDAAVRVESCRTNVGAGPRVRPRPHQCALLDRILGEVGCMFAVMAAEVEQCGSQAGGSITELDDHIKVIWLKPAHEMEHHSAGGDHFGDEILN